MKFRFYDPDDEPKKPAAAPQPAPQPIVYKQATHQPPAKKSFTLDWVHELGWSENPFTTLSVLPAHQYIVNQEAARQAINMFFIKEQTFGTITAEGGAGKTFLLQWLAEELQPYKDRYHVYRIDASMSSAALAQHLTQQHSTLLSKYRGENIDALVAFLQQRAKRRIVLLIDNGNSITELKPYLEALREKLGAVIIIAGTKPHLLAPDTLAVTLTPMSTDDATKMLEKRIARVGGTGTQPFTPLLIAELWKASRANPVLFLQYCNETAMKIALKQFSVHEREEQLGRELAKNEKLEKSKKNPKDKKKTKNPYDDLISDLMK